MTNPLPTDPPSLPTRTGPHPRRATPTDDRGVLRILPPPDTEPDYDPDPYWARPRLSAIDTELPLDWNLPDREDPGVDPSVQPPGAKRAAWLLVNGYLEVLAGRRPASQLTGTAATPAAARQLAGVAAHRHRRLRLHRLLVLEQLTGRAEVVVLLADLDADQVVAIAMRLVHVEGAWRCAAFQGVW